MNASKMLAELRQERDRLDEVILSFERLARGQGKRRGRPPSWLKAAREPAPGRESSPSAATANVPKKRGRPGTKTKKKATSQKSAGQTEESVAEQGSL